MKTILKVFTLATLLMCGISDAFAVKMEKIKLTG